MELEVKKPYTELEEGKHTGTISKIERRLEPYDYVDVFVKPDDADFEIKYGCPANLSTQTKLGKLLGEFAEIKEGEKLDPEKILLGQEVQFITMNEARDGMVFARVVDNSIKKKDKGQ